MLLAADVGNTNVTLGLFEGERLTAVSRLVTDPHRTPEAYGRDFVQVLREQKVLPEELEAVVIASVVPAVTESLAAGVEQQRGKKPFLVDRNVKTGIVIKTDAPEKVGPDRIVNAAAAWARYGGPVLVIDFGTATTYDYVTADGEFLGGVIAPGMKICAEALWEKTAVLPQVALQKPERVLGRNTVSSMQSGVFYGYLGQVEYLVRRLRQELGADLKTIATGGLSVLFRDSTDAIDLFDEHLTLHGLRYLYEQNR